MILFVTGGTGDIGAHTVGPCRHGPHFPEPANKNTQSYDTEA